MSRMQPCIECGSPTKSHQTGEGPMCHSCYSGREGGKGEKEESDSSKTFRESIDELAAIPDPDPDADPKTCNHTYVKYPYMGMERCHRCGHEIEKPSIVPNWIKERNDGS